MNIYALIIFLFPLFASGVFLIPKRSSHFYFKAGLVILSIFLLEILVFSSSFKIFTGSTNLILIDGLLPNVYSSLSLSLQGINCLFISFSVLGLFCVFLFSKFKSRFFYFLIFLFIFFLNAAFMATNLFSFYLFSEPAIIIMLILTNFFGAAGLIGKKEMRNLIIMLALTSICVLFSIVLISSHISFEHNLVYWLLFFCILMRLGIFPFSTFIQKLMGDTFSLFGMLWSLLIGSTGLYAFWRFILPNFLYEIATYRTLFVIWALLAFVIAVINFIREKGVKDPWHHLFFLAESIVLLGLFLPDSKIAFFSLYSWFSFILVFLILYMLLQGLIMTRTKRLLLLWPALGIVLLNEALVPFTANFAGRFEIILGLFSFNTFLGVLLFCAFLAVVIKIVIIIYEVLTMPNRVNVEVSFYEGLSIYLIILLLLLMGLFPDPFFKLIYGPSAMPVGII